MPAVGKTTAPVPPPPAMFPAFQDPSSAVAVWTWPLVLVQVTVSRTETVTVAGEKLKSAIVTDWLAAAAAPPPRTRAPARAPMTKRIRVRS